MKITGTTFFLIETPRETGAISEHLLIRVDTDEGISGWGEYSDLPDQIGHPDLFPDFDRLAAEATRRLRGADPRNIDAAMRRLEGIFPAAFDIALHDLLGKILGVPVDALLGGRRRDRIPFCYPIFPLADEADVAANIRRVRRLVDLGFTRIRKYIGYDLAAEERFLRTLRDTFGDQVAIKSLDLSGRFPWRDALDLLRRFKDYDYEMAESAARPRDDLAGLAEVRRQLGLPISEHLNDHRSIVAYRDAGAVDICNIATSALGIRRAKSLCDFAHGLGLGVLHGTTQELSVGTAAAAHVCASLDHIDMPCDPAGPILYTEDCTRTRVVYEDACLVVPDGPGLGVEVDEELLESLRYKGTRLQRLKATE